MLGSCDGSGATVVQGTIGPFSLVAAGPAAVALEAAYAGGSAGFMPGAAAGLTQSKTEADFRLAHTHEGVVWVGVHATGARAAKAREILSAAGARHFQG
jgi:hypothetical protein